MKEITFYYHKQRDRSDSFSVSINSGGDLVFNEGTYFPQLGELEEREVDYYITVTASDKIQLLERFLQQCSEWSKDEVPIDDSHDRDEQLLGVVQFLYNHSQFSSLAAVEQWLTSQKIPFKKSQWYW